MDSEWYDQSPHVGQGPTPKLSWAGRLQGSLDGQPANLLANEHDLTLVPEHRRSLLTLRRLWKTNARPILNLMRQGGLRLFVQVKWFGTLEVFPQPSPLVRLFLPW